MRLPFRSADCLRLLVCLAAWAGLAAGNWPAAGTLRAADRIVLRNLEILQNVTVRGMDEDGVQIEGRPPITWDEIESGTIAANQPEFDRLLKELGTHLYRIRQRLSVADYQGLLPHAEAVYPRYMLRGSRTAYLVFQGLMWGRLATSQREAAVEPYLRCFACLRANPQLADTLPSTRRLLVDLSTGLTPELQPVWFDKAAAATALQPVVKAAADMRQGLPAGARIYYATLALAAGELPRADQALSGLQSDDAEINDLIAIVAVQRELAAGPPATATRQLEQRMSVLRPAHRPLAWYWLGTARLQSGDPRERQLGLLQLLRIPAVYADSAADLAAAALYQALQALAPTDPRGGAAVRRELLDRYGQTYHASLVRSATGLTAEPAPPDPREERSDAPTKN